MIIAKCTNINTTPYNTYPELELGKEYVLESIEVGRFHSDVKIKGNTKRITLSALIAMRMERKQISMEIKDFGG